MPNSPNVRFSFENRNVEVSTPLNGVSHVVAMTTKGKPFDPSIVITSLTQFEELFGKEVGNQGLSNIELALKTGSKLRISRVLGASYAKGSTVLATNNAGTLATATSDYAQMNLVFKNTSGTNTQFTYFKIQSKEYGNPFTTDGVTTLGMKVRRTTVNGIVHMYLDAYKTNVVANMTAANLVATYLVTKFKSSDGSYFDISALREFINTNAHFDVVFSHASTSLESNPNTGATVIGSVRSLDEGLELMAGWAGTIVPWIPTVSPYVATTVMDDDTDVYYLLASAGSAGSTIADTDWYTAFEATLNYTDAYQLLFSNVRSSLTSVEELALYNSVKEVLESIQETVLYIDVPLYNSDSSIAEYDDIITWVNSAIAAVGSSRFVAYFAGGYKYYTPYGNLVACPNGGTVLGLGDSSASNFGPWYHFSGQNRGLVTNAKGLVSPNYGSPANYSKLNLLANAQINMSVVRDTPSLGSQVMLVHNFTSSMKTDSFRFLGVVRLTLYIKKTLRPLLNNFLEEPNTFTTWRSMYYTVKPIFDDLVNKSAITNDWTYNGDQFATAYSQLTVNKEADVRQGKYRAIITFREVVALQEISYEMVLDAASGTVSINPL